jgi:hypothetical protein
MVKLTISVSEKGASILRGRASEAGLESPEAYLETVFVDELLEDDEELERELLRRVEQNNHVEMTIEEFSARTLGILKKVQSKNRSSWC